jgi:hypothetical protein
MIIAAMNGVRLKLTATRLTEFDYSTYPYYLNKADLKTALNRFINFGLKTILVRGRAYDGEVCSVHVAFSPVEGRIGCKEFSPVTFNLILRTMGLNKKAVAKKKAKGGKR